MKDLMSVIGAGIHCHLIGLVSCTIPSHQRKSNCETSKIQLGPFMFSSARQSSHPQLWRAQLFLLFVLGLIEEGGRELSADGASG